MLLVSLAFLTVGYTLLYAGIKGGPAPGKDAWARAPWLLWQQAFSQLRTEAAQTRAATAALASRAGRG